MLGNRFLILKYKMYCTVCRLENNFICAKWCKIHYAFHLYMFLFESKAV